MRRTNWWENVSFAWYFTGEMQLECLPSMVCTFLANGKASNKQTRYNIFSGTFSQTYFFLCLFHWSISAVVSGGHSICCFPHCSHMFLPCREPGVPLSLFRSYPLPFPCPFVSIMFLSLPFLLFICSLVNICGSFRRHSIYGFSPL